MRHKGRKTGSHSLLSHFGTKFQNFLIIQSKLRLLSAQLWYPKLCQNNQPIIKKQTLKEKTGRMLVPPNQNDIKDIF